MQNTKEELYSSPEDAANFLSTLQKEPGMFVERTFEATGRRVDVFWATVDQQEKMARFGGCIQLDTTAFTNRYHATWCTLGCAFGTSQVAHLSCVSV